MKPLRVCAGMLIALTCAATLAQEDFVPAQPLQEAGLVKYWQLQLPLERDQVVRDVYLVDDQLYLGTDDGYVYAVHAGTGAIRWMVPVTRSGYHVRRPCHTGDRVVFVTQTDIQVYDRQTGEGLSRTELRFAPGTPPVSDGLHVYIGGIDRRLYALDAETLFLDWRTVTDAAIAAAPAWYDKWVFTATDSGTVYACTRGDKAFGWQSSTYGPVRADLVATESGVYVASQDQSLYLLDHQFGQPRWRARFSGPLYEAPVVTPELVYQYCPNDGLVAVENAVLAIDERIRWKLPEGRTLLTVHAQLAYVLTADGRLLVVQPAKGQVVATIRAPGFTLAIPAPEASTVFLASPQGQLFCARPPGAPPLTKDDVLKALQGTPATQPTTAPGAEAATQPATRPATQPATAPATQPGPRRGLPLGGKSKISRGWPG